MSKAIKHAHYFKVFMTDDGYVINDDGEALIQGDRDKTMKDIGASIMVEIENLPEQESCACYGYRIDYRFTPITKDPFK